MAICCYFSPLVVFSKSNFFIVLGQSTLFSLNISNFSTIIPTKSTLSATLTMLMLSLHIFHIFMISFPSFLPSFLPHFPLSWQIPLKEVSSDHVPAWIFCLDQIFSPNQRSPFLSPFYFSFTQVPRTQFNSK